MDREAMGLRQQERVVGQDPQLPQGFYPVTEGVSFLPGDQLTVTCEFDSTSRDRPTYAGSTSKVAVSAPLRSPSCQAVNSASPSLIHRGGFNAYKIILHAGPYVLHCSTATLRAARLCAPASLKIVCSGPIPPMRRMRCATCT